MGERESIELALAHHELVELFGLIITGDDVARHKPDPEGILFALKTFGIDAKDAVMLGDTDKDMGAARNAGVDRILFFPAVHEPFYNKQQLLEFEPVTVISDWKHVAFAT